ncbi:MAG TPA: hypothetical protein QF753_06630 [Victivallales bacterium]|nr:hypothetical protein [Victivallales bacterium]
MKSDRAALQLDIIYTATYEYIKLDITAQEKTTSCATAWQKGESNILTTILLLLEKYVSINLS